jgi:hypothetical protein
MWMRVVVLFVLAAIIVFAAMPSVTPTPSRTPSARALGAMPPATDLSLIDPAIQGEERAAILGIIQTERLEPGPYTDILYMRLDGRVFANRPEVRGRARPMQRLSRNVYRDSRGAVYVVPEPQPLSVTPTCDGTTGPYRRIHSAVGKWGIGTVRLIIPGAAEISVNPAAESAYVMLGGWGANGGAVDAGFLFSPAFNDWTLFIDTELADDDIYDTGFRFLANQNITNWRFWSGPNMATVMAYGCPSPRTPGPCTNRKLVRRDLPPGWGWNYPGTGMVLKQTTSIAQATQNFSSGAYLRNVNWYGPAQAAGLPPAWHTMTEGDVGGYCSWPGLPQVGVSGGGGPGRESVSINLTY